MWRLTSVINIQNILCKIFRILKIEINNPLFLRITTIIITSDGKSFTFTAWRIVCNKTMQALSASSLATQMFLYGAMHLHRHSGIVQHLVVFRAINQTNWHSAIHCKRITVSYARSCHAVAETYWSIEFRRSLSAISNATSFLAFVIAFAASLLHIRLPLFIILAFTEQDIIGYEPWLTKLVSLH